MENKYYIPDVSDIRVGYECEFKWESGWRKEILKEDFYFHSGKNVIVSVEEAIENEFVRTPYLAQEQIEAEGWRDFEHTREVWLVRNNWVCVLYSDGIRLTYVGDTRYNGKCLSINEFRYICKLLGINEEK